MNDDTETRRLSVRNYHASPYPAVMLDSALISWIGGIALHRGFGVPVPFIAAWLLIALLISFIYTAGDVVSAAYFKHASKAAAYTAAGTVVGMMAGQIVLEDGGAVEAASKIEGA